MTPAMAPLRRRRFAALGLIASLLFAGCASSEPIDFVGESCPPTALRFPPPPPADGCYVRLRQDARPLVEHGRDSYIGANRLGEQQFKAPLAESILRVLARDLRLSGLCRTASLRAGGRPWRLDVDVLHATASFTQGLPDLVPVIPAALEAHVELRLVFSDEDGRVYLDRTFEARRSGSEASFGGPREAAAELLGEALRAATDEALTALREAYDAWWRRFPAESRPAAAR